MEDQHIPILEFLFRKPGVSLPELSNIPGILENRMSDVYGDLQRSNVELYEKIANLQVQNKELRAYASTVAHDLKEPLAVMLIAANLIDKISDMPRDELQAYLRQIKSAVEQMNTTINTLLFFAKVSRVEAPVEYVDMSSVVTNVQERLAYMIKEHQAQLDLPKFWPDAIGYAPWIEEVWANYLSNALKYGGNPPHIKLGASAQPDGMICYWIRDNGPGLTQDAQLKLFSPFDQLDIGKPGNGLGLSIVLGIIEKLGGEVGFESELGRGSRFFFTLPAAPQP
ncbi:MAG: HAMP domain-containing sensor histidine kinase [Chloroflexota bacterium]